MKPGKTSSSINRRQFIASTSAVALSPALIAANGPSNVIHRENAKPGTRDWILTKTAVDPKTKYRCPWIEGYCSRTSVKAGEKISFHVSTNPPSPFTIELYRMGYYGGEGGRRVGGGDLVGDGRPGLGIDRQ